MAEKYYFESPLGAIEIIIESEKVNSIEFVKDPATQIKNPGQESPVYLKCSSQLKDYFEGGRKEFSLPLFLNGTGFQNKVWTELYHIPYGATISYSELARRVGDVKAVRAVGSANGSNPFVIVVPCHRVIGKNGKLTGYGGGLWRKKWLLEHEAQHTQTGLFASQNK